MDLNQFDKFIKQVNEIHCCCTPGCKGALTPVYVKSVGLGGTVSISCTCNDCGNRGAIFETSKYELGSATKLVLLYSFYHSWLYSHDVLQSAEACTWD